MKLLRIESRAFVVRFAIAALIFSGGSLAPTSCTHAPPTLSPAGAAAFQATRVVKALDVLRDFAIDAEAQTPKMLSTANARTIVTFHESAIKTIAAVPGGWKPTVTAGLEQLQHDLPAADWQRVAPYVNLVRVLIASLP